MSALTEERMEQALSFLAGTDIECAEKLADMERLEFKAKSMKAAAFLHLTGTVAEREASATVAPDVLKAYGDYFAAIRAYNAVKNQRSTESIVVDAWRSVNSNRRMGSAM